VIDGLADDVMGEFVDASAHPEDWAVDGVRKAVTRIFGAEWEEDDAELRDMAYDEIRGMIIDDATKAYEAKETDLGSDKMRELERMLMLQFTDQFWKDHLLAMDRLRDGIGLRGYGQRNPLLEYKKEGTDMFHLMNSLRDEAVISRVLRIELAEGEPVTTSKSAARALATGPLKVGAAPARLPTMPQQAPQGPSGVPGRPQPGVEARAYAVEHGVGRNAPCPCGSKKKFKKCCYAARKRPGTQPTV